MDPLFVKKVCIDWTRVPVNSYLNHIPALKGVEEISFRSPVYSGSERRRGDFIQKSGDLFRRRKRHRKIYSAGRDRCGLWI